MSTQPKSPLTPEQYLEIERKADYKSEFLAGEIFAMAGASLAHNYLTLDLAVILYPQVRRRGCRIFTGEMRVQVTDTGLFTYPDVVVVCDTPRFLDEKKDTLLNPTFLAEVLSPSTEAYDRGLKFEHYRKIETLNEYLLIAQNRIRADLFMRQPDGRWLLTSADGPDEILELESLGCKIPMAELYQQVELPPASNEPR